MPKPSAARSSKKPSRPPARRGRSEDPKGDKNEPEIQFLPPLKPRRKLLLVLSAVLALWIAFLLVLRFTTVTGHGEEQHPHDEPAQRQPVEGTVPRSP